MVGPLPLWHQNYSRNIMLASQAHTPRAVT
jgi:hypothetical protein